MARKRKALWELEQEQQQPPKMLLVHMMDSELRALDEMQGGPSEDPRTGFREYSKLAPIFEIPQVQEIFKTVSQDIHQHGKLSPELNKMYKMSVKEQPPFIPTPPETKSPLKEIEETSRAPDKRLAWLPDNICKFFIDINGHFSENPKTGLLEFGFLSKITRPITKGVDAVTGGKGNEIIRMGATVAGGILGGPVGAGLGNAAGHMMTGNNLGNAAMSGLKNWGLGSAVSGLGSMMGAPAMGGMFGGQGLGLTGMASGLFGGTGNAAAAANGLSGVEADVVSRAAGATGAAGAGASSAGGMGGMLGGVGPFLAAKLAMDALALKGEQEHHEKKQKDYAYMKAEEERRREDMGFNKKWERPKRKKWIKNPESHWGPNASLEGGPMYLEVDAPELEQHYKKGGRAFSPYPHVQHEHLEGTLVKGPGDGQADKIRTSVPEGSYIIDATSVSDFGNGSSEAGAKVLKNFEREAIQKFGKFVPDFKQGGDIGRPIPVWLSNDEVKLSPLAVNALGHGSNQKGAQMLKNMVKNLRIHKNSNGNKLPPKAKDPFSYINVRRA